MSSDLKLNYVTVDVFADTQFGGNPLAVVLNAADLTSEQMQKIAAEFNLAETTFVLPPVDPNHTANVRIFTPRAELPFAGHPNIGTAFVLSRMTERPNAGPLLFEEKAGLVELDLLTRGETIIGATLAAPQGLSLGQEVAPQIVADACSLSVEDLEVETHAPLVVSCGVPFVLAEVKSMKALSAARPNSDMFSRHIPMGMATGVHLYVSAPAEGLDLDTRMFAPLYGIPEDPATGSANVALGGLLAHFHPDRDITLSLAISQGRDMGRPSRMLASAEKVAGKIKSMKIGGTCFPVSEGVLTLSR